MLSRSRGEGGYRDRSGSGTVESTLTALFPYARYALSERLSVWGMTGYGEGTLTLTPTLTPHGRDGTALRVVGTPLRPDLGFAMGALGLRSCWSAAALTGRRSLRRRCVRRSHGHRYGFGPGRQPRGSRCPGDTGASRARRLAPDQPGRDSGAHPKPRTRGAPRRGRCGDRVRGRISGPGLRSLTRRGGFPPSCAPGGS